MVDQKLLPAIKEALKQNEIGSASPYVLSYAQRGSSGASFGVFQGDTNASADARGALVDALQAASVPEETIIRILGLVARPCPNGDPLTPEDRDVANAALSSDQGKPIVDGMDAKILQTILSELDTCVAAATARGLQIDPVAQLYMALWVNMTGPPDVLTQWLGGNAELGVPAPTGPSVNRQNIERYLHATKFFLVNPQNFLHLQQSVDAAIPLLPSGAMTTPAQPAAAPPAAASPPVVAQQADPPQLIEQVPFAQTSTTMRYWPILSSDAHGREVTYMDVNGRMHGSNLARRFFADRDGGARHHAAVDIYGNAGDVVVAVEAGQIVHFYSFYNGVFALIVQCDADLVINYGEVDKDSLTRFGLQIGSRVSAGQPIAIVGRSTTNSMMCHFETYVTGTTSNQKWMLGQPAPRALLNPTAYLLELARSGL